jgi:3-dehydroquinate dehydratase II
VEQVLRSICGFGADGYIMALRAMQKYFK